MSQVTEQVSCFPLPQHQQYRRAGAKPCCREQDRLLDSSAHEACGLPRPPPWPAHACENPPMGTAVRMASGTGVASLPCLQEHPICRSPGGIPFWREARRASIPPGGLGTHPIPHILPRWEVLTASPGRDGIPLEGQDTCPGRCPDSPSSNCAVSISAITESSRARPRTPGKAG